MKAIDFSIRESTQKLATGKSKMLGNPNIWEGFEWPYSVDLEGDEFDLTFLCQINCAEIAHLDRENKLPHTGMLYFFYDYDELPISSENATDSIRVIYHDCDPSTLDELVIVDDDGNELAFHECEIVFEKSEDELHHLLGEPDLMDYGFDAPEGHILLAQIDSFSTAECDINFIDVGVLQFYITPEDLEKRDFSKVQFLLVFS